MKPVLLILTAISMIFATPAEFKATNRGNGVYLNGTGADGACQVIISQEAPRDNTMPLEFAVVAVFTSNLLIGEGGNSVIQFENNKGAKMVITEAMQMGNMISFTARKSLFNMFSSSTTVKCSVISATDRKVHSFDIDCAGFTAANMKLFPEMYQK